MLVQFDATISDMDGSSASWSDLVAHRHSPLYRRKTKVKSAKARQIRLRYVATRLNRGLCLAHLPRPRRIDLAAICAANLPSESFLQMGLGAHLSEPHNVAAFFSIGSSTYWPTLRTPDTAIPIGFAVGFGE